jgi:predicted component of type VI protein secretion system
MKWTPEMTLPVRLKLSSQAPAWALAGNAKAMAIPVAASLPNSRIACSPCKSM